MITENLKKLNVVDNFSLVLFALYKIKDIPDYRVLSELVYSLDKDSFLRLCSYLGGETIRIPKIDEIEVMLYCLLIWEDIHNGGEFEQCLQGIDVPLQTKKQIRELYSELSKVLADYEFVTR